MCLDQYTWGLTMGIHYPRLCHSRDDIFLVTDSRVLKEDMVNGQKIFVFFALDTHEKTLEMEKFLNQHDFLFLMADYVPFTD